MDIPLYNHLPRACSATFAPRALLANVSVTPTLALPLTSMMSNSVDSGMAFVTAPPCVIVAPMGFSALILSTPPCAMLMPSNIQYFAPC